MCRSETAQLIKPSEAEKGSKGTGAQGEGEAMECTRNRKHWEVELMTQEVAAGGGNGY